MSEAEIRKIVEEYESQLLAIEGVTGVGITPGNGSINIYVEKLTPKIASFLPNTLNGIHVRIVETGGKIVPLVAVPVAKAIYAERTGRYRPAPGGVSLGHPQVTAGTFGCRAVDKQLKQVVGLSNNHVIALDWGTEHIGKEGDNILQPGPHDGGVDPTDKIGELLRWVAVSNTVENLIDAAIFRSDQIKQDILDLGIPDSLVNPYVGMNLVKSGRTSGVTFSRVLGISETVKVSGWGEAIFRDQITTETALLSPGDSGSWVGEADTYRTVGIGHAGSDEISVVCKGGHVESLLGVQIIPPVENLPWYTTVGILGTLVTLGGFAVSSVRTKGEGIVI